MVTGESHRASDGVISKACELDIAHKTIKVTMKVNYNRRKLRRVGLEDSQRIIRKRFDSRPDRFTTS